MNDAERSARGAADRQSQPPLRSDLAALGMLDPSDAESSGHDAPETANAVAILADYHRAPAQTPSSDARKLGFLPPRLHERHAASSSAGTAEWPRAFHTLCAVVCFNFSDHCYRGLTPALPLSFSAPFFPFRGCLATLVEPAHPMSRSISSCSRSAQGTTGSCCR